MAGRHRVENGEKVLMTGEAGQLAARVSVPDVVAIRAGHDGPRHQPVVAVTEAGHAPRVFAFADDAARDRFLLELVEECERQHGGRPGQAAAG